MGRPIAILNITYKILLSTKALSSTLTLTLTLNHMKSNGTTSKYVPILICVGMGHQPPSAETALLYDWCHRDSIGSGHRDPKARTHLTKKRKTKEKPKKTPC